MKEWNNEWNSFNSVKVLIWREWLEGCARGEFLPPIVADTDPVNKCNFDCIWCNAYDYMMDKRSSLPEEHLIKLADFYKEWGIKSTCIAGGGEPLLNPGINNFLKRLKKNNIEAGIITNGSLMDRNFIAGHIEIAANTCRWYGISMDAGTSETYVKVKGIKNDLLFNDVIKNIEKLTKAVANNKDSTCDVAYKYLLHPLNALEILKAAKLAKSIGIKDFHLRPVGWENVVKTEGKEQISFYDLKKQINEQIEQALELEDENFNFYGVRHKFNPSFERKVTFEKCRAIPLIATFGADGKVHLCFDMRGRKDLILCSHYPDPHEILRVWGSDFHKKMIASIDPKTCPRCTFIKYNEIVENVFMKDGMCKNFP